MKGNDVMENYLICRSATGLFLSTVGWTTGARKARRFSLGGARIVAAGVIVNAKAVYGENWALEIVRLNDDGTTSPV